MIRHFKLIGCNVLRREIYAAAALSPHIVDVVLLPQGLHDYPDLLRERIQAEIDRAPDPDPRAAHRHGGPAPADQPYDAVLLGYALCSNGCAGIAARECPVVIPRAHDCVSLLLGSSRRYREYFNRHPGTYWYSRGWIETTIMPGRERMRRAMDLYARRYGAENAEYLMRMESDWLRNYRRAAYVAGVDPHAVQDREFTRQCAAELGWEYDELPGDNGMLQRLADGVWAENEMLVVPPGRVSAADPADDGILKLG